MSDKLAEMIDAMVREAIDEMELDETSTTGGVAGYLTPYAFKKTKKSVAQTSGYKLHPDNDDDENEALNESRDLTSAQKIGHAISEINKQINMIERVVNESVRLKNESNMGSQHLWKRTSKTLARMESKILRVAKQIRELKG